MKKQTRRLFWGSLRYREGISIIEVLTALAVATIGVFGVLVLIPFAVKQSQLGLDSDAADTIGRNAIEDLKIYGFTAVSDDGQLNFRGSKVQVISRVDNNSPPTPNISSDDEIRVIRVSIAEALGVMPPATGMDGLYDLAKASETPFPPNFYPVGPETVDAGGSPTPAYFGINSANPRIIHFDPIAVSGVGFPQTADAGNPDFLTGDLPPAVSTDQQWNDLRVTVATGVCPGVDGTVVLSGVTVGRLLDQIEVNRIFRTEDDLVTGEDNFLAPSNGTTTADAGTDLPQPVYDVSVGGNLIKRQSLGRISWSAVLVPEGDPTRVKEAATDKPTEVQQYKVYILVYKDRSVIPTDPRSTMRSAIVSRHSTLDAASGNLITAQTNGGHEPEVNQIYLRSASEGVFKDDWVMLINRRPAPDYTGVPNVGLSISNSDLGQRFDAAEAGYDVQLGFAKVQSVRVFDANNDGTDDSTSLGVNGGPFNFYYSNVRGTAGSDANARPGAPDNEYGRDVFGDPDEHFTTETYAIHLQNVINVYERTITLEKDSVWN